MATFLESTIENDICSVSCGLPRCQIQDQQFLELLARNNFQSSRSMGFVQLHQHLLNDTTFNSLYIARSIMAHIWALK